MRINELDMTTTTVKSPDGVSMEVKTITFEGDDSISETIILSCPEPITNFQTRRASVIELFDKR